jgi:CheY-like chemotaxis protein
MVNTLSLGSQELRRNTAMEKKAINILMVEDDEVDIMNVRRIFHKEKIDHSLFVAQNGRSALTLLTDKYLSQDTDPWLILLDMNLPQMSGLELLRALSQDPRLAAIPRCFNFFGTGSGKVRAKGNPSNGLHDETGNARSIDRNHCFGAAGMGRCRSGGLGLAVLSYFSMAAASHVLRLKG